MNLQKSLPWFGWVTVFLAIAGLYILAFQGRMEVNRVQEENDQIREASRLPDYVHVQARLWVRGVGESDLDWAARVGRIIRGEEVLGGAYSCRTISGCKVPGGEIEVCVWCDHPQSPECAARLAASVAAFCEEFDCTDCD